MSGLRRHNNVTSSGGDEAFVDGFVYEAQQRIVVPINV